MKKYLLGSVAVVALTAAGAAIAADLPVKAPPPPLLAWDWGGWYIGAHVGGMWGTTNFSDPFGASIFGDNVRTPGFLGGAQIGYNWQAPHSPWVFGVQADISGLDSQGTNTCFAWSGSAINTTCRVRPEVAGTLTGRVGHTFGPDERALLYVKGGLAWANSHVDMALNNDLAGLAGPAITSNSSNLGLWGGTVGAGAEFALTPAWSLFAEYDYLGFGSTNVPNLGTSTWTAGGAFVSAIPPGSSGVTQNIQEFKLGLNYKVGADPHAGWGATPAKGLFYKAPTATWASGWEFEGGGRYWYDGWGRFQKDLGQSANSAVPPLSDVSRLTYNTTNNAGEFFARVDSPWNVFVKGFIGGGSTASGNQNDEDFGIVVAGYVPYSNTLSPSVTGNLNYATIDAGYDWLRGPGYKVGSFVGYNYLNQNMFAHGCIQISNPNNNNCVPPVPTSAPGGIDENDRWQSLRVGLSGEAMVFDRVNLSGDVAYLPYVSFNGVDQHFFLDTGTLASYNPEWGHGQGVQLEAIASYYLTPQFSIGIGGRYWAMWTTKAYSNRTIDCSTGVCVNENTPAQNYIAAAQQAGVFVQASYKFGLPAAVVAKD